MNLDRPSPLPPVSAAVSDACSSSSPGAPEPPRVQPAVPQLPQAPGQTLEALLQQTSTAPWFARGAVGVQPPSPRLQPAAGRGRGPQTVIPSARSAMLELSRFADYSRAIGVGNWMGFSNIHVDALGGEGCGLLHEAVRLGRADLVTDLCRLGANPDLPGPGGLSPLQLAAFAGRIGAVAALIAAGANINLTGTTGDTPLHLAARRGQLVAAQMLLDAGARTELRNAARRTAREQAEAAGHDTLAALLRSREAPPPGGAAG